MANNPQNSSPKKLFYVVRPDRTPAMVELVRMNLQKDTVIYTDWNGLSKEVGTLDFFGSATPLEA